MATPALRRQPLPVLASLLLAVLLAHAWLLARLPLGAAGPQAPGTAALLTRQIVLPAVAQADPAAAPKPRPAQRRLVPRRPASADRPGPPRPDPRAEPHAESTPPEPLMPDLPEQPQPSPAAVAPDAVAAAAPDAVVAAAPDAVAAAASAADPTPAAATLVEPDAVRAARDATPAGADAPPVYPTRLPPAASLQYELRRGRLTGEGQLHWRPGPEGYELLIEGRAFGLPILGWVSRGGFDAAGLAPQRFVDRRRGRDLRAANFQRDKGVISWSTSTAEHPLLAGAQDRLSWMVQLAAIVEADPRRFEPGERVVMQVAGARGDADLWTFSVAARESVDLAGGTIERTLRLRRQARKPFDTVVDVWLDPARAHLPVRLKLASAEGDDALEFRLQP